MSWVITGDIAGYSDGMRGFLRSRPIENTVLLTVLEALRARGLAAYGDGPALLGSWEEAGCAAGAFVHTPPFPALLSTMPDRAIRELAMTLAADGRRLPGVTARSEIATGFAAAWEAQTGTRGRVWERRRLYRLSTPRPPAAPGRARLAGPADRDLLLAWYEASERELRPRPGDHAAAVDDRIGYGGLTLWEVGGLPVALAGRTRVIAGMVRIAPVYTPPRHRRHGYGAAATAAVSDAAVDAGADDVVLFADLAAPAVGALYTRIGCDPLDDYLVVSFDSVAA